MISFIEQILSSQTYGSREVVAKGWKEGENREIVIK
jgi:hypothetical protein